MSFSNTSQNQLGGIFPLSGRPFYVNLFGFSASFLSQCIALQTERLLLLCVGAGHIVQTQILALLCPLPARTVIAPPMIICLYRGAQPILTPHPSLHQGPCILRLQILYSCPWGLLVDRICWFFYIVKTRTSMMLTN